MLNSTSTPVLPKRKLMTPKQFTQFVNSSGFRGGSEEFLRQVLNTDRFKINYQLKTYGNFDDIQKMMLVEKLKDGKSRGYGIDDSALSILERLTGITVPRGGDITATGDNIAINSSSVHVSGDRDYKALYLQELKRSAKMEIEITQLKIQLEGLKELLNESGNKEGN